MSVDSEVACRKCGTEWVARFEATGLPTRIVCPKCRSEDAVSIGSSEVSYLSVLGGGRLPQRKAENLSGPGKRVIPPSQAIALRLADGNMPRGKATGVIRWFIGIVLLVAIVFLVWKFGGR